MGQVTDSKTGKKRHTRTYVHIYLPQKKWKFLPPTISEILTSVALKINTTKLKKNIYISDAFRRQKMYLREPRLNFYD